jgi:hypothetical protein
LYDQTHCLHLGSRLGPERLFIEPTNDIPLSVQILGFAPLPHPAAI